MQAIPTYRIIELALLGDGNVGKTALLRRFKGEEFDQKYRMTIGADFVVKKMQFENTHLTLQIWDVGGQIQFSALRSRYYRNAAGILVVFDLTDRSTYESIPHWLYEVLKNNDWRMVPLILVGNKSDLVTKERWITRDEINKYVGELREWGLSLNPKFRIRYLETSAKHDMNVYDAFTGLLDYIVENPKFQF